jgi:hypothetical protein
VHKFDDKKEGLPVGQPKSVATRVVRAERSDHTKHPKETSVFQIKGDRRPGKTAVPTLGGNWTGEELGQLLRRVSLFKLCRRYVGRHNAKKIKAATYVKIYSRVGLICCSSLSGATSPMTNREEGLAKKCLRGPSFKFLSVANSARIRSRS